ncbi:hypothetical protein J6590_039666 [Homalodisca vitripennis]|nr:hypothetical protein J6590_039666 [Homalodisca vitripennis]
MVLFYNGAASSSTSLASLSSSLSLVSESPMFIIKLSLIHRLKVGTHITAPRPTRESADCWPSHGETIAAQYLTCKFRHVRTDTRPSWPHRARTVTDMFSLNFDGHETCSSTNSEIVALGLHTDMCGLTVTEPSPHRQSADSRVGHDVICFAEGIIKKQDVGTTSELSITDFHKICRKTMVSYQPTGSLKVEEFSTNKSEMVICVSSEYLVVVRPRNRRNRPPLGEGLNRVHARMPQLRAARHL